MSREYVKGIMPRHRISPIEAAEIEKANAQVAKTHERGFCTWTLGGRITGPYRLMSKGTVRVKTRAGAVETVRVVNVEQVNGPKKLYVGDCHPDDAQQVDRLAASLVAAGAQIIPPPDILPDVPGKRQHWSRLSLESLLEDMVGTLAMARFRATLRGLPRLEQRAALNAEIDRLANGTLRLGERWCDLEARLEELVGSKGLQTFIGGLQGERNSALRMAAIQAEIERAQAS